MYLYSYMLPFHLSASNENLVGPAIPLAMDPPLGFICLLSHKISAGFPSPAADYSEEKLDLNHYLVRNQPATFMFTVRGDSMTGSSIEDGDKVVVDRSCQAYHQDIVVAIVDGSYTIKRLYKKSGRVELQAENKNYSPITFSEGNELQIWGVVVGVVRRYGGSR